MIVNPGGERQVAKDNEQIQLLLTRLGAERLAAELVHLADYDRAIERRVKLLAKEADPKGLAAELGRRIGGLRRSSRFVHS